MMVTLLCILLITKSKVLPDLWVGKLTCWYKPMASIVSKKIAESMSSSLLTCKLKSPSNRLSGYFGRRSITKLVKSSRKALLVDLFFSE